MPEKCEVGSGVTKMPAKDKKPKEEKEEEQEIFLPFKRVGNLIFEAIYCGQIPCWLGYNIETKKFRTDLQLGESTDKGRVVYKPIEKNMIAYQPYTFDGTFLDKLCKLEEVKIPNLQAIYQKLYDEFDTFLDIDSDYKHLEVAFCLETYQQHKLNSTGYLYHTGEHDSGKSTPLKVQSCLAYRPLFGVSINEANVYEVIGTESEGLCTILEDEAQEFDSKNNAGKMAVYRAGYTSGSKVPRIIEGGSSKRQMKFYNAFCCKAFSGYCFPKDPAFESRNIEIPFVEGHPKKDEITKDDVARMEKFKPMMLLWRMVNYGAPVPELDLTIRNWVKQVWKGKLIAVSGYDVAYKIMLELSEKAQLKRFKSLHESLEAHITKAVVYISRNMTWGFIPFAEIWDWVMISLNVPIVKAKDGSKISFHQAYDKVYVESLGRDITKTMVGRKLDSALHGESTLKLHVGRMWRFDKDSLGNLLQRYSITDDDINKLESFDEGIKIE